MKIRGAIYINFIRDLVMTTDGNSVFENKITSQTRAINSAECDDEADEMDHINFSLVSPSRRQAVSFCVWHRVRVRQVKMY